MSERARPRRFYLALHGETEFNVQKRAQGRCDSPLTERGRREGASIGAKLRSMGVVVREIVSSPLGRCCATAAIIAGCLDFPTSRIATDPRLDEVSLGLWEGLTEREIREGWPAEMKGTTDFDWFFRAPGGERVPEVQDRLRAWLASQTDPGDLLVVGHGVSSRLLRGLYADLAVERALQLDVDRDAVFILEDRDVVKIPAG